MRKFLLIATLSLGTLAWAQAAGAGGSAGGGAQGGSAQGGAQGSGAQGGSQPEGQAGTQSGTQSGYPSGSGSGAQPGAWARMRVRKTRQGTPRPAAMTVRPENRIPRWRGRPTQTPMEEAVSRRKMAIRPEPMGHLHLIKLRLPTARLLADSGYWQGGNANCWPASGAGRAKLCENGI